MPPSIGSEKDLIQRSRNTHRSLEPFLLQVLQSTLALRKVRKVKNSGKHLVVKLNTALSKAWEFVQVSTLVFSMFQLLKVICT
jgi:hypothetical protein